MIKPIRSQYGYRNLLAYKKAEELQLELSKFVSEFKKEKTLTALADQMERSARSTKQNIAEGWKRNSTNEYYQFLGFAVASNAELEEDFTDICKGIYESKGVKGLKGGKGLKWEKGEKGEEIGIEEIEKIPFFPLNPLLPLPLKLKLRAKEINLLIDRLQNSLADKMKNEGTLSFADKLKAHRNQKQEEDIWFKRSLDEHGSVRLENGMIVNRNKWEKGEIGNGLKEWEKD